MNYLIEDMAKTLKTARESKGLSQRELSSMSGVPQSHISKIESGAVDLRVSSLIGLARELGLELTLIPRKTVPAVSSIVRSSERQTEFPISSASKKIRQDLKDIEQAIGRKSKSFELNLMAVAKLQQQVREIQKFKIHSADYDKIKQIKSLVEGIESASNFEIAADEIDSLRNALAHNSSKPLEFEYPRSAYSLEGDDNA